MIAICKQNSIKNQKNYQHTYGIFALIAKESFSTYLFISKALEASQPLQIGPILSLYIFCRYLPLLCIDRFDAIVLVKVDLEECSSSIGDRLRDVHRAHLLGR